jgi:hypothetical protein
MHPKPLRPEAFQTPLRPLLRKVLRCNHSGDNLKTVSVRADAQFPSGAICGNLRRSSINSLL